jgi:ribosome-binding protein aMBF1 (putative translation factor)
VLRKKERQMKNSAVQRTIDGRRRSIRPTPIDAHVGIRIRDRRREAAISQPALGDSIGVTVQQLQKYERGANRISAGRLFEVSKALGVPVGYFFEGLEQ